jgi:multidrug efflux pump
MPLAFGTGWGLSFARRSASPSRVLLVSQTLTFFTTPVIYLWFDRLAAASRRRRVRRMQHSDAAATHAIPAQQSRPDKA